MITHCMVNRHANNQRGYVRLLTARGDSADQVEFYTMHWPSSVLPKERLDLPFLILT